MTEIWKDVDGYEDIYEISNLGYVKSRERMLWNGHTWYEYKERLLKRSVSRNGYHTVRLTKDKKGRNFLLHRLLAIHFIPNPDNLPIINHIDGNKLNNSLDNLEWTTRKENNRHAIETGLNTIKKPIKGEHIESGEVFYFDSAREASRALGVCYKGISGCVNGHQKTSRGYRWRFSD